jgi:ATP-dependent protease ClpP protease subunit
MTESSGKAQMKTFVGGLVSGILATAFFATAFTTLAVKPEKVLPAQVSSTVSIDLEKRTVTIAGPLTVASAFNGNIAMRQLDNWQSGKEINLVLTADGGDYYAGRYLLSGMESLRSPVKTTVSGTVPTL